MFHTEKRKLRRLSEIISEWDRPSRTSLSNLYAYARRESVYLARKKLAGLKDWALDLLAKLKSKQGMAIRREARATKLVASVLVVFLACWLPFFTLNMVKVYKLIYNSWTIDWEIWFHWFTSLGYLNSSLNFFIYSTINPKFRHSFRRLLRLQRSRLKKEKSWMLPPKQTSKQLASKKISLQKPEIVIDQGSANQVFISNEDNTTFRMTSDKSLRRSSSEMIGGLSSELFIEKQKCLEMSDNLPTLHKQGTRMRFDAIVHDQIEAEIFV